MALPKAAYVLVGLFLGAGLGWYAYDNAAIGAAVGATCGMWCAIMLHLINLPSKPSAKSKPLVQAPEQELVKQWTKDEKTAGNVHDQVAPAQERPTHIQRLKNNRKYLDKSNHVVHKHDKQHDKHESHLQ